MALSTQHSDSPVGPENLLGRAQVTVSLPETQTACGEDVRLCDSSGITMQTSEKQEPNISQGL
jgi:hypothetical protein